MKTHEHKYKAIGNIFTTYSHENQSKLAMYVCHCWCMDFFIDGQICLFLFERCRSGLCRSVSCRYTYQVPNLIRNPQSWTFTWYVRSTTNSEPPIRSTPDPEPPIRSTPDLEPPKLRLYLIRHSLPDSESPIRSTPDPEPLKSKLYMILQV